MIRTLLPVSILLLCAFFIATSVLAQPTSLRTSLEEIGRTVSGELGIAMINPETNDTLSINGDERFPMQSVFKFHIALAALHLVDEGKLFLDQKYRVTKDHYFETWSVLMRDHPQANMDVTLRELISWMVMNSDNVACDILFEILGGPKIVQAYIHGLGINDIAIVATEREMHGDWTVQFTNWTTPKATAQLLKLFYEGKVLRKESKELLWKLMVDTPNAPKRLKGMLPEGTVVARKPGTGDRNGEVFGAVNDVGILVLPNGRRIIIAAFVTRAKGEFKGIEEGIAKISRTIYDYYSE